MTFYQDKIIARAFDADKSIYSMYHKGQRELTTIETALQWMMAATFLTVGHPEELKA